MGESKQDETNPGEERSKSERGSKKSSRHQKKKSKETKQEKPAKPKRTLSERLRRKRSVSSSSSSSSSSDESTASEDSVDVYASMVKETEQKTKESNAQMIETVQTLGGQGIPFEEWKRMKVRESMASQVNTIKRGYVAGICSNGSLRLVLENEMVSRLANWDDISFPDPLSGDLEERRASANCVAMLEQVLLNRLVVVHIRKY
jgi:hypothetical protein